MPEKPMPLASAKNVQDVSRKLAKMQTSKHFRQRVHQNTATSSEALEDKRTSFQAYGETMKACTDAILKEYEKEKPDEAKIMRLMNMCQLTMFPTLPEGFGNLFDALTLRVKGRVKKKDGTKKTAFKRTSVARMLFQMEQFMGNINFMLFEYIVPMLNELGIKHGAWLDENNVFDPGKYAEMLAKDYGDDAPDAVDFDFDENDPDVEEEAKADATPEPVENIREALKREQQA